MKRIITICICLIMAATLLAGCAPESEAATPSPTPAVSEAAIPEATPEPTPTPEPQPTYVSAYTVVLGDAPEDFAVDERYAAVKFKDTEFEAQGEEITLKEVQAAADPGFVLYWFEDADGITQYRAYGEKYELLTRTDVDDTVTEFIATEPVESGLYPVTITRTDDGLTFAVDPYAKPITADTEKWKVEESAKPTKDSGSKPTPKSGSGNSGSNLTPAPSSGGGGGGTNPTPAPDPSPAPPSNPAPTPTEVPLPEIGGMIPIGGW